MNTFERTPAYKVSFIQNWVKEKVEEAGSCGAIIGLSGGIDSAVLAVLLNRVFGEKMLALLIPCHSASQDLIHAKLLSEKYGIPNSVFDISKIYDDYIKEASRICEVSKLAVANTISRLRMTTLYAVGQSMNYLVCGSSNKSEFTLGYFTKYGDSGCDLLPIADLLKREIYEIAEYFDIPRKIIDKPPSAGLWKGQTDEQEIGLPYSVIDQFIATGEADISAADIINRMNSLSAHKRAIPPICTIK
jgi:NAD+ synthase